MKKVHNSGVVGLLVLSSVSGAAWAQAPVAAPASQTATAQTKTEDKFNVVFSDEFIDKLFAEMKKTQEEYDKAVAAAPNDPDVYKDRGDFYYFKNLYDKALADYQKVVQLNPKSVSGHRNLAQLYRQQKDVNKALAEYGIAIALEAPQAFALGDRADYFAELGRYAEALADYNKKVVLTPEYTSGYFGRAKFYAKQQQYDKALLDYEKLIALEPKDFDYRMSHAQTLRQLKRFDESTISYRKALEINPRSIVVLNSLGVNYWTTKSYEMAEETFNKALALRDLPFEDESTVLYIYLNRGRMYFDQGKRAAALADLNMALLLNKTRKELKAKDTLTNSAQAQAYFYRSFIKGHDLLFSSKEADKTSVIADVTQAMQLNPALVEDYIKRTATLLSDRNMKYGLVALLTGVAAAKPDDIRVFLKLAEAQSAIFDSKSAIESYTTALALDPKSLAALSGRAAAYTNKARPYKTVELMPAVADWKMYLTLKPTDTNALVQLGIAQYNVAQTLAGIATFRQVLTIEKENAYAHVMLALGLAINGDKDGALTEAQNYLKKLTKDETKKAKSHVGNAKTHYPQNEAVKALDELVPDLSPKDDEDETDLSTLFFL